MKQRIVFVNDCMKECFLFDKEVLKQKVIEIINRAENYINSIEEGGSEKIADQHQGIFVKLFITGSSIDMRQ